MCGSPARARNTNLKHCLTQRRVGVSQWMFWQIKCLCKSAAALVHLTRNARTLLHDANYTTKSYYYAYGEMVCYVAAAHIAKQQYFVLKSN